MPSKEYRDAEAQEAKAKRRQIKEEEEKEAKVSNIILLSSLVGPFLFGKFISTSLQAVSEADEGEAKKTATNTEEKGSNDGDPILPSGHPKMYKQNKAIESKEAGPDIKVHKKKKQRRVYKAKQRRARRRRRARQEGVSKHFALSDVKLTEKAGESRASLQSSADYHSFQGMVRNILAWSSGLLRSLNTKEKVSDASSAQMLKTEHDNLKADFETCESTFSEVTALGEAMVAKGHRAEVEVSASIDSLLTERQKLHMAWQHKKVYLNQLINVQCYLSDIKERTHLLERCQLYRLQIQIHDIKTWVNEKTQVALDKSYYNLSNLQNKIQKHAVFEAEVAANKSHLMAINTKGEELCSTGHYASQEIASQLKNLNREWTYLQDTSKLKRERLQEANTALKNSLLLCQFNRQVTPR